jgi:hypothetical protein
VVKLIESTFNQSVWACAQPNPPDELRPTENLTPEDSGQTQALPG